jgi:hypothetical protein
MRHQRIAGRPPGRLCRKPYFSRVFVSLCRNGASLVALALAFAPHTAASFIWGVLLYNGIAGMCLCGLQRAWLSVGRTGKPRRQHAAGAIFRVDQCSHRLHDMGRRARLQAFWRARTAVDRWPRQLNLSHPPAIAARKRLRKGSQSMPWNWLPCQTGARAEFCSL